MKRCYESGASKRKRHAHAKNELSKQNNSLDAFVSRKHVHDDEENLDYAVAAVTSNVTANTDTDDNSGHTQSTTNVNVTVGDNLLQKAL
jgi:ribosomal protein L18